MQLSLTKTSDQQLKLQWDTGQQLIGMNNLSILFPQLMQATQEATFQGKLTWEQTASENKTQLTGILKQIQLGPLLNPRSEHYLSGRADLYLQNLEINNEKIASAHGWLIGQEGQVSLSLVQAAQTHLAIQPAFPTNADGGSLVGYTQLAIEFQIEKELVSLKGACDPQRPGIMLLGLNRPLVVEPATRWQPAISLIPALSSPSSYNVPATAESGTLLRWLASPSSH